MDSNRITQVARIWGMLSDEDMADGFDFVLLCNDDVALTYHGEIISSFDPSVYERSELRLYLREFVRGYKVRLGLLDW